MKLHGYFRSSASYRVRIALNLKGLVAQHLPHHLRKGEQCAPDYLAPQSARPGADAGGRCRRGPDPVARHHRMARRDPSRTAAAAEGSAAPRQGARVRAGARLRHPSGAEFEGAGAAARARPARGEGHGLGGLGQPRGACGLRDADQRTSPVRSASAPRRRSPISAWCRSSPMRAVSASMSRPIRGC